MDPLRKLTPAEVDRLQVLAQEQEELAEELRRRAVAGRQLRETGLEQTLVGLRTKAQQVAAILDPSAAFAVADLLRHDAEVGIVDQAADAGWIKTPELQAIMGRLRAVA